jgi:hypothetical protein
MHGRSPAGANRVRVSLITSGLLAFLVHHVLADRRVVLPQLQPALGVVPVLLEKITMAALRAYHFHVRTSVFAFLGHCCLPPGKTNDISALVRVKSASKKIVEPVVAGLRLYFLSGPGVRFSWPAPQNIRNNFNSDCNGNNNRNSKSNRNSNSTSNKSSKSNSNNNNYSNS